MLLRKEKIMRKVLLVCAAGMSTSLLMNKMREYAQSIQYDMEVDAQPFANIDEKGAEADVILLGPQIRFNLNKAKTMFPNKPIEAIDIQAYGTMNGEKVVNRIQELLGD